jgi:hypothetical protein
MSASEETTKPKKLFILSVLLGTASLLTIVILVFALLQRAELQRMKSLIEDTTKVADLQRLEAMKQKQRAEELEAFFKLRIEELEYKYDMCMTNK